MKGGMTVSLVIAIGVLVLTGDRALAVVAWAGVGLFLSVGVGRAR